MATVPTITAWTPGLVTEAMLNSKINDPLNLLLNPPACGVQPNAGQSIPNQTTTDVTFATEQFDTDAMFNVASSATRITIVTPGLYNVFGQAAFAANGTGARIVSVRLNGSSTVVEQRNMAVTTASVVSVVNGSGLVRLSAGDYLTLGAYQSSGGALNTAFSASFEKCMLQAIWVAK